MGAPPGRASVNKTHIHKVKLNTLFQFCLTITKLFSPIYLEEMKNYSNPRVSRTV